MDQNRLSALSRPSPHHPKTVSPEESSELPLPSILSLCTGLEAPEDALHLEDVDVRTKLAPAVTHEHVQPLQHTYLEHRITREIHTHDVYHRVLPIVDTEILPPRHFIDDGINRREVSAEDVRKYTATGRPFNLLSTGLRKQAHVDTISPEQQNYANFPVTQQEPILADKRTYMTDEGYPRTEYLWLHPPVFEYRDGRTSPVLIPAGLSPEWKAALSKHHRRSQEGSGSFGNICADQENAEPMAKRRRTQGSREAW